MKAPKQSWAITATLAAATVLYLWQYDAPSRRAMAQQRQELDRLHHELQQTAALESQIRLLRRQEEQAARFLTENRPRLPESAGVGRLLASINDCAIKAGTQIEQFLPLAPVAFDQLHQVPLKLTVTGTITQVYTFLHHLESLPRTMWLSRLHLAPQGEDGETILCETEWVIFARDSEKSD